MKNIQKGVIHNTNESDLEVKIRGEQGLSIGPTIREIGQVASEICTNKNRKNSKIDKVTEGHPGVQSGWLRDQNGRVLDAFSSA